MIIGLTGSIASGKSTVANMLMERGYPIVDADKVARLVVEPGTEVIQKISVIFGQDILLEDGSLNREKLGAEIFGNPEERQKLNEIIHPAIREEMKRQRDEWIQKGEKIVFMDIPLLFENQLQSMVDKTVVVSVTPEIQKARLMERNDLTEKEANERIQSQISIAEKVKMADAVIDNDGTVNETEEQLEELLKKWHI